VLIYCNSDFTVVGLTAKLKADLQVSINSLHSRKNLREYDEITQAFIFELTRINITVDTKDTIYDNDRMIHGCLVINYDGPKYKENYYDRLNYFGIYRIQPICCITLLSNTVIFNVYMLTHLFNVSYTLYTTIIETN
jgi:hypothetical protein